MHVYCLLFADDSQPKENYRVKKEIVKSQQKEEYVIENIVVGQTIGRHESNPEICPGKFVNGSVTNLANLSKIRP